MLFLMLLNFAASRALFCEVPAVYVAKSPGMGLEQCGIEAARAPGEAQIAIPLDIEFRNYESIGEPFAKYECDHQLKSRAISSNSPRGPPSFVVVELGLDDGWFNASNTPTWRANTRSGGVIEEGATWQNARSSTPIRIQGDRIYGLMPSKGGTGPLRWQYMNKPPVSTTHGNFAGDQIAWLYRQETKSGEFLKWGVSQNPMTRYPSDFMLGKRMVPIRSGPRRQILDLERSLVESVPGFLNFEPWAGWSIPH